MNNTRKYWSENCCKFRKHDETIFLVSAGGVLFLTVMFYAITHWCAERKIPTILQRNFDDLIHFLILMVFVSRAKVCGIPQQHDNIT